MNQQDLVLVRDSIRGNAEAFTMLVRNYKDFVYRIVYAILQNHVDTEDVLQETFIKATDFPFLDSANCDTYCTGLETKSGSDTRGTS